MRAKKWTASAVREFRRIYASTEDAELAARFQVTENAIDLMAKRFCISKNKNRFGGRSMPRWSPEELEYLRVAYATTTNIELARVLRRSVKSVANQASELGLPKEKEHLSTMARAVSSARASMRPC